MLAASILSLMWLQPLALAAGALLLAGPVYSASPALSMMLVFIAGVSSIWAAIVGFGPKFRSRDAYDLRELKRVHEEEELFALHSEGSFDELDRVVCIQCMEEYSAHLGVCPRCGKSG